MRLITKLPRDAQVALAISVIPLGILFIVALVALAL